ncbi:unnamed protein product, partial [Bubo scandiacus]
LFFLLFFIFSNQGTCQGFLWPLSLRSCLLDCCLQERACNPQSEKTGGGKAPDLFLPSGMIFIVGILPAVCHQ